MKEDTSIIQFRQPGFGDPRAEIARDGARRMLATALGAVCIRGCLVG